MEFQIFSQIYLECLEAEDTIRSVTHFLRKIEALNVKYESYGMFPPPINASELERKARIRMEQTRKDIIEMNSRISHLIQEMFGEKSDTKERQHDEEVLADGKCQKISNYSL